MRHRGFIQFVACFSLFLLPAADERPSTSCTRVQGNNVYFSIALSLLLCYRVGTRKNLNGIGYSSYHEDLSRKLCLLGEFAPRS